MLTKYQLFGIFNLLISFLLIFVLTKILIPPVPLIDQKFEFSLDLLILYSPKLTVVFSLIINLIIAYKLILKNAVQNFKIYAVWTLATILWLPLMFIGYFFASSSSFLVISLFLTALTFYLIQKISKKSALFISVFTIIVMIFSILAGFEEAYCWGKGDEALAKNGQAWISASKEDAAKLNGATGMEVKEGSQISPHFRAHFLCHRNFNFSQALKEKYLFSK